MTLTEKEESLVQSLRALPVETADQVIGWTSQLAQLANGRLVEWSDAWTRDDLLDASAVSLRNFEDQDRATL